MMPTTNRALVEAEFDIEGMLWNLCLALSNACQGKNPFVFFSYSITWARM